MAMNDCSPLLADVVDRADVGMVEGGRGTSFTSETFQCLRVSGNVVRQEFEGDKTTKLGVLGLVNYAHTAAAELFDDAVVRDGLADHSRQSYGQEKIKSMKGEEMAET